MVKWQVVSKPYVNVYKQVEKHFSVAEPTSYFYVTPRDRYVSMYLENVIRYFPRPILCADWEVEQNNGKSV